MARYARKVLKIRELSPFVLKFPVEFVPVFQKDLGWPSVHSVGLFWLKITMPTMLLFARAAHCQIFSSPEKLNFFYVCLLNLVRIVHA